MSLGLVFLACGMAPGAEPATVRGLIRADVTQLEGLFRQAAPMEWFPAGDWKGRVLPTPGRRGNGWKGAVLGMGWLGKRFDVARGIMTNRLPLGTAVPARMVIRPSSLDGGNCLCLDYSGMQGRLTRWADPVHDEVREIAPGVLLGFMSNAAKPNAPPLWFVLEKAKR